MGEAVRKLETFDERCAERVDVKAVVDVFGDDNFWTGLSVNISEGGIFVATYAAVPIGAHVTVQIAMRFEDEPLVVDAVVRWTRAACADAPPGIGLQFVDIDERTIARVREFIQTVREPLLYEAE
ncbi:MAG: TIGR02266 family protein [Labilithrix sp.]|nr:TIGR02266 family protein [Labilithrix sp.]